MAGIATNHLRKLFCGRLPGMLGGVALCALVAFAPAATADPLSPVRDTLERTTDTVGRTVSGAGNTVNRTTDTLGLPPIGDTVQDDRPLSSVNQLGRDITQPLGTLTAPAPATTASGPAPSQNRAPDEYRPHDAFYPYTPDLLPKGTLARVYFQPGETTLDLTAKNQLAGFVNAFSKRIGNVELRGYADRGGGRDAAASDIAMQRALAVQQALLEHGMSTGRMRASGMGNVDSQNAAADRVDILFDGY